MEFFPKNIFQPGCLVKLQNRYVVNCEGILSRAGYLPAADQIRNRYKHAGRKDAGYY